MSYLAILLLLGTRAAGVLDPSPPASLLGGKLPLARPADPTPPGLRLDAIPEPHPSRPLAAGPSRVRPWVAGGLDEGRDRFAFAAGAGFVFD